MTQGRYVRFEPKHDNAEEIISAEHMNLLQDVSERTQQAIYSTQDRDFLDKALFLLEHHRVANGMWIDLFEDTSRIDLQRTKNLVFSEVEKGIIFPDSTDKLEGWLYSKPYINENLSNMKKVMVVASNVIPNKTNIIVEISNNDTDWYTIPLSNSEMFEMPTDGAKILLRAKFERLEGNVSPRLDAWTILFHDPENEVIKFKDGTKFFIEGATGGNGNWGDTVSIMHSQLTGVGPNDHHPQEHSHNGTDGSGLISHESLIEVGPDDHHQKAHYHGEDGVPYIRLDKDVTGILPYENLSYQIWTGRSGMTGLYFDAKQDDKLVYVKTPDDETYLFYDNVKNILDHTITIVDGIAVWEQMIFGTLTNSNNETVSVLNGTEKTHYDASDAMIISEIEKVTAPKAPVGILVNNPGTGNDLNLSWAPNKEGDLLGYNVYKTSNNGITYTLVNTTGILSTTGYVVSGLTQGTLYTFAITAIDASGYESEKSALASGRPIYVDTIAPSQVTGVQAVRVINGEIDITFNPNTEPDLDVYNVYISPTNISADFVLNGTVSPSTGLSYTVAGLTPGDTYYFCVTAVDTSGNESVLSIIVSQIA